ncbi:hypothetical protein AMATHDRAFT_47618 [Amanita thiersii Skay4041]|uniref:Uncharacterized protein n=1 Tax=Amanita thiersii Skay4041 TaxID=703135 RepID=A0A2A9NR64_9AGAR|nr:hypothetical protein AMATHDRAFT_47618 [Amanita thiersii Skay4041]
MIPLSALCIFPLFWLATCVIVVHAFNFSVNSPRQCDPLDVTWSGGRPPFQLLIIPPGGTIRNISIPAAAFNEKSKAGSFSVQQLRLPQGSKAILSMSDASGIFAGGTSEVFTVEGSTSGQSCNMADPGTDFFFSLDSDLAQCREMGIDCDSEYPFTRYNGAILPITILVHIPQGNSFAVYPPPADSFVWTANVTAGTPVAFSVYDAQHRIGGTSSIRIVQLTNQTSCLSSSTSPNNPNFPGSGLPSSAKKGLAIGISIGVVALLLIAFLIAFVCYKRLGHRRSSVRTSSLAVDLTYDPRSTPVSMQRQTPPLPLEHYMPTPFVLPALSEQTDDVQRLTSTSYTHGARKSWLSQSDPPLGSTQRSSSQPRHSKWSVQNQESTASSAITGRVSTVDPSDIVVHTDIEDTLPIEIPPQYSENRTPLPGFPSSQPVYD